MLYTQILREKIGQIVEDASDLNEAVERIAKQDSIFFSERFLSPRPLLDAITSEEPVVLLIDEVDRADEALEAVLLELLSEFQISIPEVGTITAKHLPYVVLTSNNTRDLSAALKRRCLHLFLDYPESERELAIIRSKDTGLAESLAVRLVEIVRGLRELELRKSPSISETIDWARTLAVLGIEELTADVLSATLNVVVKYERDLDKARKAIPHLVDPNATVPDSLGHGHGHGHGHGSDHGTDHRPDDGDVDGRAKRAAKDLPGRHDAAYQGIAGSSGDASTAPKKVSAGQGERSFAARSARKRPV
ncbi:MAG: AAA family ATPase [Nocardioides sp.]